MRRIPQLWGIHAAPSSGVRLVLGVLPFVLLTAAYLTIAHIRLQENPREKLTPSVSQMADAVKTMAFTRDDRTGAYLMLADTASSVTRILIGLGAAAVIGLFAGLTMGMLPGMGATALPVVTFLSIIPPLAILPILFISFGVGELGKVMLIFLGSVFIITCDIYYTTKRMPREQIVKALTLGATQFQVLFEVVLPQVMPRLVVSVRLCLGAAWLFLIASEAIASTDGLGYRVFLVRRYLAMDVIIPYVLWITFLGFAMDSVLRFILSRLYPWYETVQ